MACERSIEALLIKSRNTCKCRQILLTYEALQLRHVKQSTARDLRRKGNSVFKRKEVNRKRQVEGRAMNLAMTRTILWRRSTNSISEDVMMYTQRKVRIKSLSCPYFVYYAGL